MNFFLKVKIYLKGRFVGKDIYGNRYYIEKAPLEGRTARRWIIYKGTPEASKLPPECFGWIHYQENTLQLDISSKEEWEKPHTPNLTGTLSSPAYKRQANHYLLKPYSTYESWVPGG